MNNIGKNNGQSKGFNLGSLFAGASALQQAITLPGAHMGMVSGASTRVPLDCSWHAPDKWHCMFAGQFAQAAVGVLGLEEQILTALEGRRLIAGVLGDLCDIVDEVGVEAEPWTQERVLGKLAKLGAITRVPKGAGWMQSTPQALAFYRAWAHQAQKGGCAWTPDNMRQLGVSAAEVAEYKTPFIWKVPLSPGEMTPNKLEEIVRKTLAAESKLTMLGRAPGGFVIQAASTPDTRKLQPGARPRGNIPLKGYRPEDGVVYVVMVTCNAGRVTLSAAIPRVTFDTTVLQEPHLLRGQLDWKGLTAFPIVQEIAEDYLRMFLNSDLVHQHFPELVQMLTPAPAQVVLFNMAGNPKLAELMTSVEAEQRAHIADCISEKRLAAEGTAALVGATAAPESAPVGELEPVAQAAAPAAVGELHAVAEEVMGSHIGQRAPEEQFADLVHANAPAEDDEEHEHQSNEEIEEPEQAAVYEEEEQAAEAVEA